MDLLSVLGEQLVFFALSALLMQMALKRRPEGGLFSALRLGMLPALLLFGVEFAALQQRDLPEVKALLAAKTAMADEMTARFFPKPDQEKMRVEAAAQVKRMIEIEPAVRFIFQMALLAGLAAWFRRRQARMGLASEPGPLSRWTAPFGLLWLVIGPVFALVARSAQLLDLTVGWRHAIYNVLAVGLALYLFQGLVVLGAKLAAWHRDPRTRAFAPLVLAAAALSLLFQDGGGLFVVLLFTGLFEPWIDLRRLHQPPPDNGSEA